MISDRVPHLLADTLKRHCNVNAFGSDWPESLRSELNHPNFPDRAAQFRQQLAEAILYRTITPAEYERLTDHDFDTPEELEEWLRGIWRDLYGDEPVVLSDNRVTQRV